MDLLGKQKIATVRYDTAQFTSTAELSVRSLTHKVAGITLDKTQLTSSKDNRWFRQQSITARAKTV